jgi:hypothetical protein
LVALFAYLFLPALCLTFAGPALPAESIHVVIRFKPGVISFPAQDQGPGYGFEATLADAEIAIPGLRGTLAELGVVSFETIGATWRHVQNPVLNRHGIPVNLVDFTDVYNVTFEGPAADSLLARLRRAPGLSYARIPRPFKVGFPNDPYYESGELWHLNNTGQTYEGEPCTPDLDIDADSA